MGKFEIDCSFWIILFTLFTGYSEPPSAGCKQYTVGFPALDNSSSTATAEIAVNGMDPPELGFSPAESTTGTSGQSWHKKSSSHTQAAAKNLCFFQYVWKQEIMNSLNALRWQIEWSDTIKCINSLKYRTFMQTCSQNSLFHEGNLSGSQMKHWLNWETAGSHLTCRVICI